MLLGKEDSCSNDYGKSKHVKSKICLIYIKQHYPICSGLKYVWNVEEEQKNIFERIIYKILYSLYSLSSFKCIELQ